MQISINTLTSQIKKMTKQQGNEQAYKGWITKNVPWKESAIKSIMQFEWMAGLSKDGYKRRTSIYAINALFLDIDDETIYGDSLLNFVHKSLSEIGLSHAIATSTHHLKVKLTKRGVELPACPRIKLMIPLEQLVSLPTEEDKDDWNYSREFILKAFNCILRAIKLDASSLDVNRASFRMNTKADNFEWRFYSGDSFNIQPYLRVMPPPEKFEFKGTNNQEDIISAASHYFSSHHDRDEWLKVAAAIYHEFNADVLKKLTKVTKGELDSFKRQNGRVCTAGTVFHYACLNGWQPRKEYIEQLKPKTVNARKSLSDFNNNYGY